MPHSPRTRQRSRRPSPRWPTASSASEPVVIGSNVFNLAALLGLGAVVAGRIALHRKVVVLSGVVAAWIAVACVLVVLGLLTPVAGTVVVAVVFVPYLIVLGLDGKPLSRLPRRLADWMAEAVIEEEIELPVLFHDHGN